MALVAFGKPCRSSMKCDIADLHLKVLGKSVGLCKTTKRKDQLYISVLVSVWRIILKFQPKRTHINWDVNENISKENKKNSGFGEALQ